MTFIIGLNAAAAAPLKDVRFSEAVHNLGYINLYVGIHAGIFQKNGLNMKVSAAGGDTQTFAAVLGGSADFAGKSAGSVESSTHRDVDAYLYFRLRPSAGRRHAYCL